MIKTIFLNNIRKVVFVVIKLEVKVGFYMIENVLISSHNN